MIGCLSFPWCPFLFCPLLTLAPLTLALLHTLASLQHEARNTLSPPWAHYTTRCILASSATWQHPLSPDVEAAWRWPGAAVLFVGDRLYVFHLWQYVVELYRRKKRPTRKNRAPKIAKRGIKVRGARTGWSLPRTDVDDDDDENTSIDGKLGVAFLVVA